MLNGLKVALSVGAVGAVAEYGIARYFYRRTIIRSNAKTERTQNMAGTNWELYMPFIKERKEWLLQEPMEQVSIQSKDGLKLQGTYFPDSGNSRKYVICCHGYTSKGMSDYIGLSKYYKDNGFHILLPDARAHGESEGKYIGFGCLDRWDVLEWVKYLENRFGKDIEIILHGTSMGGATVLMASGLALPGTVKAIVSDCAFTCAFDVFKHVLKSMYHLPAFPILQISDRMLKKDAGYGLSECNAADEVKKATVPVLFIHGDADTFVPTRMCHEIYENCISPKEILIIEGAGHAESYYKDQNAYEEKLTAFLNKIFDR